jgi:putative glutathione S-transferase
MLKRLQRLISLTVVSPKMLENGWKFEPDDPTLREMHLNYTYLHQVYTDSEPAYTGRVTVPVLWDKQRRVIVNNESSQIIRILNRSFADYTDMQFDFYPDKLHPEIDKLNDYIYDTVNNGVYRCGFATTQRAYEAAFDNLFEALDHLDRRLSGQRFLVGNRITEADWRLFTTLIRFDAVYFSHFKANRKQIADYPHLSQYLKELYQIPGIKETVNFEHIKQHYYYSHTTINPYRIIPKGPELDLESSHDRNRLGSEPIFME